MFRMRTTRVHGTMYCDIPSETQRCVYVYDNVVYIIVYLFYRARRRA